MAPLLAIRFRRSTRAGPMLVSSWSGCAARRCAREALRRRRGSACIPSRAGSARRALSGGADGRESARSLLTSAKVLELRGDVEGALRAARSAAAAAEDGATFVEATSFEGHCRHVQGDNEAAAAAYRLAIGRQEQMVGRRDAQVLALESRLARVEFGLGRTAEAVGRAAAVLDALASTAGWADERTLTTALDLDLFLRRAERHADAEDVLRRLERGLCDALGPADTRRRQAQIQLADLLAERGDHAAARALLTQVAENTDRRHPIYRLAMAGLENIPEPEAEAEAEVLPPKGPDPRG